jgi:ribosome biogenesis protein MAK21
VSVNASQLLEHKTMSGKPDMTIHTLMHFLDRFVYKTPKASAGTRGASIMQPLAGSDAKDRLVSGNKQTQEVALNSEAFWKKKSDDVAAEDVFFHEYFSRVGKAQEKSRKKTKDAGEDKGEVSDAESEIWKALVDSRPEVEGGDSDDDLDLDDLESAYDQDGDEDEGAEESGDEGVIFNDESDVDMDDLDKEEASETEKPSTKTKAKKTEEKEDTFDEDDDFDMDVSDDEAFVGSDEELPSDVELGGGVELPEEDDKSERKKKRKLKHLPTFASADDYAALLAGEDEGM